MGLRQPLQVLALSPSGELLAVACGRSISVVAVRLNKVIARSNDSDSHARKMMIRQLVWHTDSILLSSGEDKHVKEWRIPAAGAEVAVSDLALVQQFEIPKRANAISVTGDGQTIVVADKFGDVYTFPMHRRTPTLPTPPAPVLAPAASTSATTIEGEATPEPKMDTQAAPGEAKTPSGKRRKVGNTNGVAPEWRHVPARISTLTPILGHVSMLTAMLVIPEQGKIVTADRDEHVRVSKWPNSWEVEHFLLGYKKFVSALALHPGDPNILITAGGDDHIRLWDLTTYRCIRKDISVAALVGTAEIKVELEAPKVGRKMRQKLGKQARKRAEREQALLPSQPGEEDAAKLEANGTDDKDNASGIEGEESTEAATSSSRGKVKKLDLGVTQMAIVGSGGDGHESMLVVSSVGSDTCLAWSMDAILPGKSDSLAPQVIKFDGPVLSITSRPNSSTLWVSLDVSRSPDTSAVRALVIQADGQLALVDEPATTTVSEDCASAITDQEPYPTVAALFPDTALLSKEPPGAHGGGEGVEGDEPNEEEILLNDQV